MSVLTVRNSCLRWLADADRETVCASSVWHDIGIEKILGVSEVRVFLPFFLSFFFLLFFFFFLRVMIPTTLNHMAGSCVCEGPQL